MVNPAALLETQRLRAMYRRMHGMQHVRVVTYDSVVVFDVQHIDEHQKTRSFNSHFGPELIVKFHCGPHRWYEPLSGVKNMVPNVNYTTFFHNKVQENVRWRQDGWRYTIHLP